MVKKSDELSPLASAIVLIFISVAVVWTLFRESLMTFWNQYWLIIIGLVILVIFVFIAYLFKSSSIGVAGVIIFLIFTIWGLFGENIISLWNQHQLVVVGLGIPISIGIFVLMKKLLQENKIKDDLFNEKWNKEQELHKSIIRKRLQKDRGGELENLTDEEKDFLLTKWADEEYTNEILGVSSNDQPVNKSEPKEPKTEIVAPLSHHRTQKLITEIGTKCCYPNCKENITLEVHHIIPRTEGGTNKENNLVVLCNNHHKKADVGSIPRQRLKHHSIAKIKRDRQSDRER